MQLNRAKLGVLLLLLLLLPGQAALPTPPSIEAITPASGHAGTVVTITGRHFTTDNTVLLGATVVQHIGITSAIGIACTADPNCQAGIVQALKFKVPAKARSGRIRVTVKNANGASNALDFIVLK